MLHDHSDAEDATHDVFVLAWEKRASIRIVDESIVPWLLVATRNLCLNRVRKTRHEQRSRAPESELESLHDSAASPSEIAEATELQAAIDSAVDGLSDIDQQPYHLCIDQGLSYTAAAKLLSASHGSVRSSLSRLRRGLRVALHDQKEQLA